MVDPKHIDHFEIIRTLGRGGMGKVYLARDTTLDRQVAIKVVRNEDDEHDGDSSRNRFTESLLKEARISAALDHPGIVTIHQVGVFEQNPYIVMQYIDGHTLDRTLPSSAALEREETFRILREAAAALDYAHDRGVIHRDIKPPNLMLTKTRTVKICDFGIAKSTLGTQKNSGMLMGTPEFMAPEQLSFQPVDGRTDQWALAVMAYRMLTGMQPFQGDTLPVLAGQILRDPMPEHPNLPDGLAKVLRKALSKDPAGRFRSCSAFVAALMDPADTQVLPQLAPLQESETIALSAEDAATIAPSLTQVRAAAVTLPPPATPPSAQKRKPLLFIAAGLLAVVGGVIALRSRNVPAPVAISQPAPVPPVEREPPRTTQAAAPVNPPSAPRQAQPKPPVKAEVASNRKQDPPPAPLAKQEAVKPDPPKPEPLPEPTPVAPPPAENAQVATLRTEAAAGNTNSMAKLGNMYLAGFGGLAKDPAQAFAWIKKSADAGDNLGTGLLGGMYASGQGVPRDDAKALPLLQKAAAGGHVRSMSILGFFYRDGRGGLGKDEVQAERLFRKAADQGDGGAATAIGLMYLNGAGGLQKDPLRAAGWLQKAAAKGDQPAMFWLGSMYEKGLGGLPKDLEQAKAWYRKAKNNGPAQAALARLGG